MPWTLLNSRVTYVVLKNENTMEQDNVMKLESKGNPGNCWTCGLPGHKQHQCNLHNQAGKNSAISWRTAH